MPRSLANAAAHAMAWEHYRTVLVPGEIQPNGSCPREEERTNSLGYSAMNLDAFSVVCRIAQVNSVAPDLWSYRTPRGIGVATAFEYLTPYILHPDTWKKQQISKFTQDGTFFMGLAGVGLQSKALLDAHRTLPRSTSPWTQFVEHGHPSVVNCRKYGVGSRRFIPRPETSLLRHNYQRCQHFTGGTSKILVGTYHELLKREEFNTTINPNR